MAGRHITDKGGYAGNSDELMKSKTHTKHYESAEGSGGIKEYSDTSELVERDQRNGDSHIKAQPMKPGYRY